MVLSIDAFQVHYSIQAFLIQLLTKFGRHITSNSQYILYL